MGYHEISFLSYFDDRSMHFFSASQIGRQEILAKLNWPACRQSPTHVCIHIEHLCPFPKKSSPPPPRKKNNNEKLYAQDRSAR